MVFETPSIRHRRGELIPDEEVSAAVEPPCAPAARSANPALPSMNSMRESRAHARRNLENDIDKFIATSRAFGKRCGASRASARRRRRVPAKLVTRIAALI